MVLSSHLGPSCCCVSVWGGLLHLTPCGGPRATVCIPGQRCERWWCTRGCGSDSSLGAGSTPHSCSFQAASFSIPDTGDWYPEMFLVTLCHHIWLNDPQPPAHLPFRVGFHTKWELNFKDKCLQLWISILLHHFLKILLKKHNNILFPPANSSW